MALSDEQIEEIQFYYMKGFSRKDIHQLTGISKPTIIKFTKDVSKGLLLKPKEPKVGTLTEEQIHSLRYDNFVSRDLMKSMVLANCGSMWIEWRNRSSRKLCAARKIIRRSCQGCGDCRYFKVKQVR